MCLSDTTALFAKTTTSIFGGVESQVGWSPEQPDLVGDISSHVRSVELDDL